MTETEKQKIPTYTMKLRLYPSAEQKIAMDRILRALHIAYNITFHHVFLKNPAVCTTPNKNGAVWPSYSKMVKKEWRQFLISENPAVDDAPAVSLMNQNGIFLLDAKRAWQTGMHNIPVNAENRRDFRFYNSGKPRHSFFVQINPRNFSPSPDNEKVAWIKIPKVGTIKARGFNRKLWFGQNGQHTYTEALQNNELPSQLSVRVSKDRCGDYYVSVTFSEGSDNTRCLFLESRTIAHKEAIGIDVGIKHIAILSTGQKIENKHFKLNKQHTLSNLNRSLSRRWGPSNMAFRDYNRSIRQENRSLSEENRLATAKPSNRYLKTQYKKAVIERKIAQRRNTYYHQQTANLIQQSNMIAMETLLVSNMLRNHKLAYALSDAAMSDFLAKLVYKADRYHIPVFCIGIFEPTSQLCSSCGRQEPRIKNLSIRTWTCPNCGQRHDRDINAAKNILQIAISKGGIQDKVITTKAQEKSTSKKQKIKKHQTIQPGNPEIAVVFSKELTHLNDPRYVIINTKTNEILDDAQGVGYRSSSNAKNCYKAKLRFSKNSRTI